MKTNLEISGIDSMMALQHGHRAPTKMFHDKATDLNVVQKTHLMTYKMLYFLHNHFSVQSKLPLLKKQGNKYMKMKQMIVYIAFSCTREKKTKQIIKYLAIQ